MKHVHPSVRQFLDTEAQVDEQETEEEEDEEVRRELEDAFIDDRDDDEPLQSQMAKTHSEMEDHDDELDDLIERVLARVESERLVSDSGQGSTTFTQEAIAYRPRDGDYPLWRVYCRVGIEETAVFSLMNTARDRHEVRSVFTRGTVRGSIYIESTMNKELLSLLKITPGIIRSQRGVHRQMIERHEYVDTLKMKNHKVNVEHGDWVVVNRGLYKGDVAFVKKTRSWGATVLLVPRLDQSSSTSRKRKASCSRPKAELFDPEVFRHRSNFIKGDIPDYYNLGNLQFVDGLLKKNLDYHSFETGVTDIPYDHFLMFRQSGFLDRILNPNRMLRPREWSFNENDRVTILSKNEQAILIACKPFYAEVERGDPLQPDSLDYTAHVPWHDIRKDIQIGNFVRVGSGPWAGEVGWVVEVKEHVATIVKKIDGEIVKYDGAIEYIDIHVNSAVLAEPPHQHQPAPDTSEKAQQFDALNPIFHKAARHPWCGTNVTISRRYHIRKGETGVIQDVTHQRDKKTMKLTIQLTRYKPSEPFKVIVVDYDDVVESKSKKKLDDFFTTPYLNSSGEVATIEEMEEDGKWNRSCLTPLPSPLSHEQTDFVEEDASNTPWWDPSSRSPMPGMLCWMPLASASTRSATTGGTTAATASTASTSAATSAPMPPPHVLINRKLVGVQLNVIANGGGFSNKELSASIQWINDRVVVRHIKYNTSIHLQCEWITPKHPSPTHDNGLLVVIQGTHCGKYVRRIHHRHHNGSILVVVAVVTRSEGSADVLTGEQIEFEPEYLCTVHETKAEKDRNRSLMSQICKDHQHLNRK